MLFALITHQSSGCVRRAVPVIILKKIRFAGSLWIWPVLDIVEEKVLSALGLFLRCCESDGSALDRAER